VVLYNREINRWRVVVDVSDELLDQALAPARARLTDKMLAAHPGLRSRNGRDGDAVALGDAEAGRRKTSGAPPDSAGATVAPVGG
jgi:hypothetical protein